MRSSQPLVSAAADYRDLPARRLQAGHGLAETPRLSDAPFAISSGRQANASFPAARDARAESTAFVVAVQASIDADASEAETGLSKSAAGASPAMAQWFALKAEHPDALLFFRMGDFFEMFFDDARGGASALDIALTHRGEHAGAPIPMCGVPVATSDVYLARLIRRGFRVAVAEQMEAAERAQGKGPLKRAVVRLITPGTLTEDTLLEAARPNLLLALCGHRRAGGCRLAGCLHRAVRDGSGAGWRACRRCSAGWIRRRSWRPRHSLWAIWPRGARRHGGTARSCRHGGGWPRRSGRPAWMRSAPSRTPRRRRPRWRSITCGLPRRGRCLDCRGRCRWAGGRRWRWMRRRGPAWKCCAAAMAAAKLTLLASVNAHARRTPGRAALARLALRAADGCCVPSRVRQDGWAWLVAEPRLLGRLARRLCAARRTWRARWRGSSLGRGGPRDLAAIRLGLAAAAVLRRCWRAGCRCCWHERASAGLRRLRFLHCWPARLPRRCRCGWMMAA